MTDNNLRDSVACCIREVLAETARNPGLQELLTGLLTLPGRALAREGQAKWLRFVAEPCEVLGGSLTAVPYAAAAIEFVIAAADVVDDIADGDWDSRRSSVGCGVNASLALSHLAQRALDRLTCTCLPHRLAGVRAALSTGVLKACAGEDLDLRFETLLDIGVEQAHSMTTWKSGALVAMACTVGAALATDDETTHNLIAAFGSHIGVIAQLLNDSAALIPQEAHRHSDLSQRKKTLPISFALHYAYKEQQNELRHWAESRYHLTSADYERLAAAIQKLGGLHYAWVVADTHRREAFGTLHTLQRHTERREVLALRQLIPQLHARRSQPKRSYA